MLLKAKAKIGRKRGNQKYWLLLCVCSETNNLETPLFKFFSNVALSEKLSLQPYPKYISSSIQCALFSSLLYFCCFAILNCITYLQLCLYIRMQAPQETSSLPGKHLERQSHSQISVNIYGVNGFGVIENHCRARIKWSSLYF